LNYARTLKFAAIQAKLRARIGKLRDDAAWRALALNSPPEPLEDLEGIGMDFWLDGLSGQITREGLERHFTGRVRALLSRVAAWLPREWEVFGEWLKLAPDVFWVSPVLAGEDPGMRLDADSVLQQAARHAPGQRRGFIERTALAPLIEGAAPPEELWRSRLVAGVPPLPPMERRPVERLQKTLDDYLADKVAVTRAVSTDDPEASATDSTAVGDWRLHKDLETRLFGLLAGDPFHPALILVYALLELLTMEKLRALLLARVLGWTPPPALTGRS